MKLPAGASIFAQKGPASAGCCRCMSKNQFAELLQRARREKLAGPAACPSVPLDLLDRCTLCSSAHAIGRNILYVPHFIDAAAADIFAAHIEASASSWGGWARLHRRSLLNLGGVPHPSGAIAEYLPPTLQTLCQCVRAAAALPFLPDQCLLNRCMPLPAGAAIAVASMMKLCSLHVRYNSGCGIMAHADGPLFQPRVAILSLGRPACIRFHKIAAREDEDTAELSVVLQPGSLFCFSGELYTDYKHAIPETDIDVVPRSCVNAHAAGVSPGDALDCSGCRYSITLRKVSHVAVDAEQAELPMHLEERQRRRAWWLSSINEKNAHS